MRAPRLGASDDAAGAASWLTFLRRYVAIIAAANLLWEAAQLPLYTIWSAASAKQIAFAVLHCTAGDVLIAGAALIGSLVLVGAGCWPNEGFVRIAVLSIAAGLGYSLLSEYVNTQLHGIWAYRSYMPTLPGIGIGLTPVAQWLVIPTLAFWRLRTAKPWP